MAVLRKDIRKVLESTGFSVEIYEADSTPSFEPATYLQDIRLADFVIFVFDETYGTPRPSTGKSGVHEEWNIVKANKIPNHVYLKRKTSARIQPKQKAFITEELEQREISYFYYVDEADLLAQVRKSIAKMTLDIGRSPEFRSHLSARALAGEVAKRDHDAYFRWDRAIKLSADIEDRQGCLSTAWSHISDMYTPFSPAKLQPFIDQGTQTLFARFLAAVDELSSYDSAQVLGYSAELAVFPFPDEPQTINKMKVKPPLPVDFYEKRAAFRAKALDVWKEIGDYIAVRYSKFSDL
jgi:hypothetical protein